MTTINKNCFLKCLSVWELISALNRFGDMTSEKQYIQLMFLRKIFQPMCFFHIAFHVQIHFLTNLSDTPIFTTSRSFCYAPPQSWSAMDILEMIITGISDPPFQREIFFLVKVW